MTSPVCAPSIIRYMSVADLLTTVTKSKCKNVAKIIRVKKEPWSILP
jgi:hypothetical protein